MLLNFVIFLSQVFVIVQSACFDNGDKEIKGLCYKFVPQKLAYENARNWCHYQNPVKSSYLAYVPDAQTSAFLASYARVAFGSDNLNFWIGLNRNNSNRQWFWDNGALVGFTYFNILGSGNYVAESTVNSKWNTFLGTEAFYFACSYDPQAPPTFAPPITTNIPTVPTTSKLKLVEFELVFEKCPNFQTAKCRCLSLCRPFLTSLTGYGSALNHETSYK
ncbi:unnamed protein product [Caenorhabditis nigoni]